MLENDLNTPVNFDLERMKKSIESGERFEMPEGLSREDFREWMRENAKRCRQRKGPIKGLDF